MREATRDRDRGGQIGVGGKIAVSKRAKRRCSLTLNYEIAGRPGRQPAIAPSHKNDSFNGHELLSIILPD